MTAKRKKKKNKKNVGKEKRIHILWPCIRLLTTITIKCTFAYKMEWMDQIKYRIQEGVQTEKKKTKKKKSKQNQNVKENYKKKKKKKKGG